MGDICKKYGDHNNAITCFRKVVKINPTINMFNRLATALYDKGEKDEAITYYIKCN